MSDIKIEKQEGVLAGRYVTIIDGREAELDFTKIDGRNDIIAVHTGVPSELRGEGVGKALVTYMIEDARENNFKIVPQCPYVEVLFKRHPEWWDVELSDVAL